MDQWLVGSVVGWISGWWDQWLDGSMVGWVSGWLVQWLDGSVVGWINGWLVGWMDAWMEGVNTSILMNGWIFTWGTRWTCSESSFNRRCLLGRITDASVSGSGSTLEADRRPTQKS